MISPAPQEKRQATANVPRRGNRNRLTWFKTAKLSAIRWQPFNCTPAEKSEQASGIEQRGDLVVRDKVFGIMGLASALWVLSASPSILLGHWIDFDPPAYW